MSDDGKKTLEYKGTTITIDSAALKALQEKVGMSATTMLTDVKDNIDWSLKNDDQPVEPVVIDNAGDDDK